jgi:hypothetical protein
VDSHRDRAAFLFYRDGIIDFERVIVVDRERRKSTRALS